MVKNPPANARDEGLIPGSGRSPGKGNGNPLQYSCLGSPMDRGAWQSTIHGVIESDMFFSLSCVRFFATPRTVAHQAPLVMEFPRQEYWSGLPLPSPWDLPDPGIKPSSHALAGRFFTTELSGKHIQTNYNTSKDLNKQ